MTSLAPDRVECRHRRPRTRNIATMEQPAHRLPLRSRRRISARDAKLLSREDAVGRGLGNAALKRPCPCNVCISGVRDQELFRRTVHNHLRRYGRHPFHRGSTEVRNVPSLNLLPRCSICFGKLCAMLVLPQFRNLTTIYQRRTSKMLRHFSVCNRDQQRSFHVPGRSSIAGEFYLLCFTVIVVDFISTWFLSCC